MKKLTRIKPEKNPAIAQEFPERLSELEVELRLHPDRKSQRAPLKSIDGPEEAAIDGTKSCNF